MTSDSSTITICIPTYNRAMFLEQLLGGIKKDLSNNDLLGSVELAISDNDSDDLTCDVISKYESDLRIKRNRNAKNIGPAANLFRAAEMATGEYIWFFSDDDMPTNSALWILTNFLSKNRDVDYIFVPRLIVDKDLNDINGVIQPCDLSKDEIFCCGSDLFASMDGAMPQILGFFSSTVIRRSLWESNVHAYTRSITEWSHLEVILQSVFRKKCAVLHEPKVLCRTGNDRPFYANSKVWFDSYIRAFTFAKNIGYSPELCDSTIRQIANFAQKGFVLDKIIGRRTDTFNGALSALGCHNLSVEKGVWYWLSFIPASVLQLAYPLYSARKWHAEKND